MRVSREKAAQTRERIVEVAGALFRAKGFGGIGVADIMKAADLTHGGFYGHFGCKDDLSVEATQRALAASAARWRGIIAEAGDKPYPALLEHYLSARHRDDAAGGCALAALGTDAARGSPPLRGAFARRPPAAPRHSHRCASRFFQAGPPAQGGRRHGDAGRRRDAGARGRRSRIVRRDFGRGPPGTAQRRLSLGLCPPCSLNVLAEGRRFDYYEKR